ncbi:MAG TPA: hypothetical protein VM493_02600 [Vicinamibacterales bacterium]|nr:hypothetical protein [Vicinamibacterales bacterium]
MARSTKQLTIGKHEYELMTLGALKGAELWLDLLRIIAVPIEALASKEKAGEDEIVTAIAAAVRSIDHATAAKFYAAFGPMSKVRVPGQSVGEPERWPTLEGAVFDDHFAGNYVEMTEWLVQSIKFNFLGFFGDGSLASLAAKVRAATKDLKSTTTSTG